MCPAPEDFRHSFQHPRGFSVQDMDMPIEPRIERDPDHPCPICGGDTELISETFTS